MDKDSPGEAHEIQQNVEDRHTARSAIWGALTILRLLYSQQQTRGAGGYAKILKSDIVRLEAAYDALRIALMTNEDLRKLVLALAWSCTDLVAVEEALAFLGVSDLLEAAVSGPGDTKNGPHR